MVVPPVAFVWSWNADLRTVTVNDMIGKTSAVRLVFGLGFAYNLNTLFFSSSLSGCIARSSMLCVATLFQK